MAIEYLFLSAFFLSFHDAGEIDFSYTEESLPGVDSSVPLTHLDPSDLGLIYSVEKCKIRF